jgi:hypothetical protein
MRSPFEFVTRRLVVLAAATSLTGCSLFLTRGPSKDPQPGTVAASAPDCTTSMAFPAIDGTFAALMAIVLLSASGERSADEEELSGDAAATMMLVTGAATVSALVGYSRVNKCRKANETFVASYGFGQPAAAYPYAAQYPQQYAPQYPPQQYPPPQYPAQQPPPAYQPAYPQIQPAQPAPAAPPPAAQPIGPTSPAAAHAQPRPQSPSALVAQPRPQPPAAQPAPRPAPPPAKPQPKPQPKPPAADASLGTEGDVCTTQSECASSFTCTGNVCLKKK